MPGPPKKPTHLRMVTGNASKRALPKDEPKPKAAKKAPPPPRGMPTEAKREWRRIVRELHETGVLTTIDVTQLELYCRMLDRLRKAEAFVAEFGFTYEVFDKEGRTLGIRRYPEVGVLEKCEQQLRMYAREFGLTPASRASLAIPKEEEGDELDAFLDEDAG